LGGWKRRRRVGEKKGHSWQVVAILRPVGKIGGHLKKKKNAVKKGKRGPPRGVGKEGKNMAKTGLPGPNPKKKKRIFGGGGVTEGLQKW